MMQMGNNRDYDNVIKTINEKFPIDHAHLPEVFLIKEAIVKIAGHVFARKTYDLLVTLGLFEQQTASALLLQHEFVISTSELMQSENDDKNNKNGHLITRRGYEFLLELVKAEVQKTT